MKLKMLGSVALATLLAGCGGAEDTAEACRYAVATAIDQGDYDAALARITGSCASAYTADERNMYLGAIYVGKAGYDVPTIVNEMTGVNQSDTDSYQSFVDAFASKASGASLDNLNLATGYYRAVLGSSDPNYCSANQASLTAIQKDACFYIGLAETATSATTLSLLFGGNMTAWTTPQAGCAPGGNDADDDQIADEAEATACAINYASGVACTGGASVSSLGPKQFVTPTGSGTFEEVRITVAGAACPTGNTYLKPITTTAPRSPVVTDGLCTADAGVYQACSSISELTNCFPCPVINGNGSMTVESTIVDALNNGSSAIIASVGTTQQSDVETAITDFKAEACGIDGFCTQSDIAAYLNQ